MSSCCTDALWGLPVATSTSAVVDATGEVKVACLIASTSTGEDDALGEVALVNLLARAGDDAWAVPLLDRLPG